jgi:hypothetical protein
MFTSFQCVCNCKHFQACYIGVKGSLVGSKVIFENANLTLAKIVTMWHLANYVIQCASMLMLKYWETIL